MANKGEIIGGADGPTSVFLLRHDQKQSFSSKIRRMKQRIKAFFTEKRIVAGTHSLEEVGEYACEKYGFTEMDHSDPEYLEEYQQMRVAFLFQYRSERVEKVELDITDSDDTESMIQKTEEFMQRRREIAAAVPLEVFDIDLHKYIRRGTEQDDMHLDIERNSAYIGGGAAGSKRCVRTWNRIYKDLYRYYGVSEEDIRTKSPRYRTLLKELSR